MRKRKRYKVVNERGIKFWVYDIQTKRRLRPDANRPVEAWYDEELARQQCEELNQREEKAKHV